MARCPAAPPEQLPGTKPSVSVDGPKTYKTSVKVASPDEAGAVTATMHRWAWYAARRAGLHLDEATDDFTDPDLTAEAVRSVAPTLHLSPADVEALVRVARIERYGAGERMQSIGQIPDSMRLIIAGRAVLTVGVEDGGLFAVGTLGAGDYIGQTALTREHVTAGVHAVDEVTVLRVPAAAIDRLVHSKPDLAREIGRAIDLRRQRVTDAVRDREAAERRTLIIPAPAPSPATTSSGAIRYREGVSPYSSPTPRGRMSVMRSSP